MAVKMKINGLLYKSNIEQTMESSKQQTTVMASDIDWESRYQAQMTGWDRGSSSPHLHSWLDSGLLKPCRIIVPGCGNGYEVLTLAKLGFEVTAIDIAETPVINLKQQLAEQALSASVLQQNFFDHAPAQAYDAIYEQTSLCALPPEQWQNYAHLLRDWLKPSGNLFAQFMQTHQDGGPPWHCPIEHMHTLFNEEDWQWNTTLPSNEGAMLGQKFEIPHLLIRK